MKEWNQQAGMERRNAEFEMKEQTSGIGRPASGGRKGQNRGLRIKG